MIEEHILDELEHRLGISFDEQQRVEIIKEGRMVAFPKNTLVLRQGESSKQLYLIIKGLVRGYYIDEEGEEVTKCLSYEDGFFCTEGFRTGKVSSFYIETLEESRCMALSYELIRRLMAENAVFRTAVEELLYNEIERLEMRSKQMMLLSAEERYRKFQSDYPLLCDRVKKQYIASYIGIKPGSLSRIIKIVGREC